MLLEGGDFTLDDLIDQFKVINRERFETFMNKLVPENTNIYTHIFEGADDMPAHIKTSVFGASLTIPITDYRLNLGTWQGIYLCEFRKHGGHRKLVVTIFS